MLSLLRLSDPSQYSIPRIVAVHDGGVQLARLEQLGVLERLRAHGARCGERGDEQRGEARARAIDDARAAERLG